MQALADPRKLHLQAGGTLNPRRHLYIERPDDASLLRLLSEGQYVNVLTSRQMGKSSLMVRTAEVLTKRGVRCVIVDLAAELGTPQDASAYFRGLLNKIARDLKIEIELPTWWAERADETMNQRLMRFFREVVLEQVPGPVVCFLDEIDSTLNPKLTWTDDLFTALRGMHNERPLVPAYERLTFCLIGVARPNELIKDRRTTPYNVASTVELRDFDLARDDLMPLVHALGADPEQGRRLIERVLYWTGGHPYLTTRLCAGLREIGAKAPEDVDRRVDDGFRSLERVSGDDHFHQVLRFLETRVANGLATFGLYEKVLKGARERDQPAPAHTELKLSGLVKRDQEGCLVVRNRIYERLFDRRWIESTRPRRALKTYRRYAIAAGVAFLIGAVAAGGWIAYLQMQLNERQQLETMGVAITAAAEGRKGTRITFPVDAPQALLEEMIPLLKAVGPVVELDLSGTKVTNLAPLAALNDLKALELGKRFAPDRVGGRPGEGASNPWTDAAPITDFAPLAGLTNLQSLSLAGTQVVAAPLAGLANLQTLDLSDTHVKDAAPLARLINLQSLSLAGTRVVDAAPLAGLINLEALRLDGTQVKDAAPLAGLTKLQSLSLAGTEIADAAPLASLTLLESLSIGATSWGYSWNEPGVGARLTKSNAPPISNFEPLSNLAKLEILDLSASRFSNLSLLAHLTNLRSLSVGGTRVKKTAPLANLTNLQTLNLQGTQVKDAAPLANLTNLQTLNLQGTQIKDAAPLAGLTNLQSLSLRGTQVKDAAPLAGLTNLQGLDLNRTQVADAAPLAGLTNLQWLDLSGTRVSQKQLTELKRVLAERGNRSVNISGP